jgi:hypothetical protein
MLAGGPLISLFGKNEPESTKEAGEVAELVKRATVIPKLGATIWMEATRTWMGFTPEPDNSGWIKQDIRDEVKAFYDTLVLRGKETTIVSGL